MSDKHSHLDLRQLMAAAEAATISQSLELDPFFIHQNIINNQSPSSSAQYSAALPTKYEPLLVLSEPTTSSLAGSRLLHEFGGRLLHNHSTNVNVRSGAGAACFRPSEWPGYGNDMIGGSGSNNNGNCRWPRQETLTLLEIRSRLDSKFKQSNQKGPLWDQVSRLMAEEYGYKRSGKKCKEKFDNLYKYYKKTKEAKCGKTTYDGKHYRFFRQLEAIYGHTNKDQNQISHSQSNFFLTNYNNDNNNNNNDNNDKLTTTAAENNNLSFSAISSSDFETSSSGNYHDDDLSAIAFMMNNNNNNNNINHQKKERENYQREKGYVKKKKKKGDWEEEIEGLMDSKVSKLMETQESLIENMLKNAEEREKESLMRDEEWRKNEMVRFDFELRDFCVRERTWLQAREAALMEIMHKFSPKG